MPQVHCYIIMILRHMRRQKSKKFVKNEDNKIIIAAKKKGKNLKIALQFLDYILPRDLIEFFFKKIKR